MTTIFRYFIEDLLNTLGIPNASTSVTSQVCVYDVSRLTSTFCMHCAFVIITVFTYQIMLYSLSLFIEFRHLLCHLYLELLFLIAGYLCSNVNNYLPKTFELGNKTVLCPVESRQKGSYPSLASL